MNYGTGRGRSAGNLAAPRRLPHPAGGLLEVVGAEGPHVPQALLLHHPDGLLLGQLQQGVVDLAHVIMEGDVPESGLRARL